MDDPQSLEEELDKLIKELQALQKRASYLAGEFSEADARTMEYLGAMTVEFLSQLRNGHPKH